MSSALQTKASKLAALTAAVSIVVMSLPVLAGENDTPADDFYGRVIVSQFSKMGAVNSSMYDNKSVETSSFDFPSYMSNTCFKPTDFDKPGCKDKFGPYANLRQTLESGKLAELLKRYRMFKGDEKVLASVTQQVAKVDLTPVATSSLYTTEVKYDAIEDRAAVIWKVCNRKYGVTQQINACFQRNRSLVSRTDVPVISNMY